MPINDLRYNKQHYIGEPIVVKARFLQGASGSRDLTITKLDLTGTESAVTNSEIEALEGYSNDAVYSAVGGTVEPAQVDVRQAESQAPFQGYVLYTFKYVNSNADENTRVRLVIKFGAGMGELANEKIVIRLRKRVSDEVMLSGLDSKADTIQTAIAPLPSISDDLNDASTEADKIPMITTNVTNIESEVDDIESRVAVIEVETDAGGLVSIA